MNSNQKNIPRKLWIFWSQGVSQAPFIVRKCINSWKEKNPDWEIFVLNKDNLSKYIHLDLPSGKFEKLPLAKQSNLIRLQLLSEYGGVWADATTFCMKPLNDWIDDYASSGFFAFYRPGPDRLLSNWFLACEKGCRIVLKLRENYTAFFAKHQFNDTDGGYKQEIVKQLSKILNKSEITSRYWLSPIATKILGVYPYFIFHYMFERLISTDAECRIVWENTKKISADGPHRIQTVGFFSSVDENIKKEIDEMRIPLYKLTWRYDHGMYSPSTLIYYLLEERH
ncbi:MAG: hypothetical protein IPN96_16085 [Anaerolineales bacterium]|nr:hypothetical protein [Anaerolineales bacterium]